MIESLTAMTIMGIIAGLILTANEQYPTEGKAGQVEEIFRILGSPSAADSLALHAANFQMRCEPHKGLAEYMIRVLDNNKKKLYEMHFLAPSQALAGSPGLYPAGIDPFALDILAGRCIRITDDTMALQIFRALNADQSAE